jgi:hypothetical protein
MTNEYIIESIKKQKIKLSLLQTLQYLRVSILFFIIALFSFTNGLTNFSFSKLESFNISFGFTFIILSFTSFLYHQSRLKLTSIETNENSSSIIEKITALVREKNWEVESEKNALFIKTNRPFSANKIFLSKSGGEKIYVFLKPNRILLRSIFDLKKCQGFVVSSGENNENEKIIISKIKPAANS